jgi:hypothetical protein
VEHELQEMVPGSRMSGLVVQEAYYGTSVDPEKLNAIAVSTKEDIRAVEHLCLWLSDYLGPDGVKHYFSESPYTPDQLSDTYGQCKTQQDRDEWYKIYGAWIERRPSVQTRFNQVVGLLQSETLLRQAYPEIDLVMVHMPYAEIQGTLMPSFSSEDTTPRINKPYNSLNDLYGGETVFNPQLLSIMRGQNTITPGGIRYQKTMYKDLDSKANMYCNDGLVLVSPDLQTLDNLQDIKKITGVDVFSAGLAEGIGLANTGSLRIGDSVRFPKYLPNTEGDYYCGIDISREYANDPYHDYPVLYFGLWKDEGYQNNVLAVTAK